MSVDASGGSAGALDGAGATLQTLQQSRDGIDRIRAALSTLRDALRAARAKADAVPGRTSLQPVVTDVAYTLKKPTFVTINGTPVQTGTADVPAGTRQLVVGYARSRRASLAVDDALSTLASTVASLAPGVGGNDQAGFAADVSALLRSDDLKKAARRPDSAAIDAALGQIDKVLAKADGLRFRVDTRASAAARVDLGGLLLGATPDSTGGGISGAGSAYQARTSDVTGTQLSTWV